MKIPFNVGLWYAVPKRKILSQIVRIQNGRRIGRLRAARNIVHWFSYDISDGIRSQKITYGVAVRVEGAFQRFI